MPNGTRGGFLKCDSGIYNGNLVYIAPVKKRHHEFQGSSEIWYYIQNNAEISQVGHRHECLWKLPEGEHAQLILGF